VREYLYRLHGDPDADRPERRGCDCPLCDPDDPLTLQRAARLYASQRVTEHGSMCDCDACARAAKRVRPDTLREEQNCLRAGYSARVRDWARVYNNQIAQDYLDPRDYDLRYLQVALIGDEVTNLAQRDRLDYDEE